MSKITFGLVPAVLVIILSIFFYMSPKILGQKPTGDARAINELITKSFLSLGNSISHATFVVDATIEKNVEQLSEIITTLRQDEPEIVAVHFTDGENKIIASSDPNALDTYLNSDIISTGTNSIKEKGGIYECGFSINIGSKRLGILYFQAKPRIPQIKVSTEPNPIILVIGIIIAIVTFIITFFISHGLEASLVEEINLRQEEVFLPKIDTLKSEQIAAQKTLDELNNKIVEAQTNLKNLVAEYEAKKEEYETSPIAQSVEKLKIAESELLKKLEVLKQEEGRLNKEITLLTQKREDIMTALEAEKKEEASLREKLDLIKKKILHLEGTG